MKNFLVTGCGFIGSHLAEKLADAGGRVFYTGTERQPPGCNYLSDIIWNDLPTIDTVFHQAAINDTQSADRQSMMDFNLLYSKNLFQNAHCHGCRRIVYASSQAVYGNAPLPYREDGPTDPLTPYAESKLLLDQFGQEFAKDTGTTVIGFRYSNVYGPNEGHKGKRASMIYQIVDALLADKQPKLFKWGDQKRDWIYVEDVVRANITVSHFNMSGVYNLGLGENHSFNEIVGLVNAYLGKDIQPDYIDNPWQGKSYQDNTLCSLDKTDEELGFFPLWSLPDGIDDLITSILTDRKIYMSGTLPASPDWYSDTKHTPRR